MLVLPHSFLLANGAKSIRQKLANEARIHCLVDLSSIPVFESVDIYVILLVFQKRVDESVSSLPATIVSVRDLPGLALEDYLEGKRVTGDFYSIYDLDQQEFESEEWILLPETASRIRRGLRTLPTLANFAEIRQGAITGADKVFIVPDSVSDSLDSELFRPLLADRSMLRYRVPEATEQSIFYPFIDGELVQEERLRTEFSATWSYLQEHRGELEKRSAVSRGNVAWWQPAWPRSPRSMLRPKLVSPHLVLAPRFGFDRTGTYVVTRSTYLTTKGIGADEELLLYLLGLLNSSVAFWYLSQHSHKYSHGYSMLEGKTLRDVPIPDPGRSPSLTQRLCDAVDARINSTGTHAIAMEREIDDLASDLYGISRLDRGLLGLGGVDADDPND